MMNSTAHTTHTAAPAALRGASMARPAAAATSADSHQRASERMAATLKQLVEDLAPQRRVVRAGEVIYRAGERFANLYILNSGFFKIVNQSSDGREQVVGLKFRGDWLGFDGIATGAYGGDAIAMDTGDVWTVRYDQFLAACATRPSLMMALHEAMSREISRDRDSLMSVCTLPADARVADFLHHWADSLAGRGLRHDQINLRLTRAEIGNFLGITLETVSRALSRLAKDGVIEFVEKGRRDIRIPQLEALADFVQRSLAPSSTTLQ